ncbi:hypothetical protein NDU88_006297 [Pleurodeles waltl]|uniref:Uncharacterized protein n=1 Tax=Pleurodeles waltl TaxID=8319 RepID=A0AAV7WXU6_PLEWA|nr:hypothetical protein NDU88_006297 [Pleurodeles waltl]
MRHEVVALRCCTDRGVYAKRELLHDELPPVLLNEKMGKKDKSQKNYNFIYAKPPDPEMGILKIPLLRPASLILMEIPT